MICCFLGDVFVDLSFCFEVLYCSVVLGCRYTHLTVVRVVSGDRFLIGICLSVTLLIVDLWQYSECCIKCGVTLCTLFMVLYLYWYAPEQVTLGALDSHWYTYARPRCRTSQWRRTFIHLSVSCGTSSQSLSGKKLCS